MIPPGLIGKVTNGPLVKYAAVSFLVLLVLGYVAVRFDSYGYDRANKECRVASTDDKVGQLESALRSEEESHQYLLAEQRRGEEIGKKLENTQRKLDEIKTEYLTYANGITGNCPADLGRVLMQWPSRSGTEGGSEDSSTRTPAHSSETVEASDLAKNIAVNRSDCERNFADHSALIEWHNSESIE